MFGLRKTKTYREFFYKRIAEDICKDFQSGALLDVGCGSGDLLQMIHRFSPETALTGIDIYIDKKLNKCKHCYCTGNCIWNGQKERPGELKFLIGDVLSIPGENEEFDRVISTMSLHHFSDLEQSFAEIYRVLKPRGKALIYDFRREATVEEVRENLKKWVEDYFWLFRPFILSRWIREHHERYVPRERIINLLSKTKFQSYRLEPFLLNDSPVFFKLVLNK